MKKLVIILLLSLGFSLKGQNILGIDVSHHQNSINWTLVYNDGKVFAFCKATEGRTYQDPNFNTYMVNGKNAGLLMGAYHFARPDNNTATQEANNFLTHAQNYIGDGYLPPVLDVEDPPNGHLDQLYTATQLTNWVQTWLTEVENQTGIKPIIYTNAHYAAYLKPSLNTYNLWIANPGTSPSSPPTNIGNWQTWLFKQYDWYGNVNGINGNVDLNVFNGTANDLYNLTHNNGIEQWQNYLHIYPNPARNNLYVDNQSALRLDKIEIRDMQGRLLYNQKYKGKALNIQKLKPGIYILQVKLSNGHFLSKRFIKK